MTTNLVHIAIVEDNDEIRESLALILNGTPGFHCKHVFPDAESAVKEIPNIYVNVVLMDIDLPGKSGIEAVALLKKQVPEVEFVMLTVHKDDESVFGSLCAGASGYLVKDSPPARVIQSVEEVHNGGSPMSAIIARKVAQSFHVQHENPLSARETEILKLLTDGMNYRAIGEELFISPLTVKSHIKNIYSKLHVSSRAEAVKAAILRKIV